MRACSLLVVAILLLTGAVAGADLCPDCRGKAYTKDIGTCRLCQGPTSSGQFTLCMKCSGKEAKCEHCEAALPAKAPPAPIDPTKPGEYREGAWEYRLAVSNEGSKSEGWFGDLSHAGKPVPAPESVNDHVKTPWGVMWWVGDPTVAFGSHRWMPAPKVARPPGRLLADPSGTPQSVVWILVLEAGKPEEGAPTPEPWAAEALALEGVKEARVARPLAPLGTTTVTLHDTKRWGRAEARVTRETAEKPLVVAITGTADATIELPWRDGATVVRKHVIQSAMEPLELWIALRVQVSAPPAAAPR